MEPIGITQNEQKVYECLLHSGSSTISMLADKTHMNPRSVYDYIERLINKGLVGQIFENGKRMFLGLNPEMLSYMIEEDKEKIRDTFCEIKKFQKRNEISLNHINSKVSMLKIIKKLDGGFLYLGEGCEEFVKNNNFGFYLRSRPKIKWIKNKVIVIFVDDLFIIYSIPDENGFFIDNKDFAENMKVYFDA